MTCMLNDSLHGADKGFTRWLLLVGIVFLLSIITEPVYGQSGNNTLNYRDADLRAFIEDVAMETRKTFIVDPAVVGKVNLISSEPIVGDALFETFLSVLRVNGMAVVPTSSGAYKITMQAKAMQDGGPVNRPATGDQLVTRVFTIRHTDPLAVQAAVKPYVAKGGFVFARNGLPIVIVSDFADNLLRIAEIISSVDSDKSVIRSLKLNHTSASEMADVAVALTTQVGFEESSRQLLKAIPVQGSNTLILKGLPDVLDQYVPILAGIDENNSSRGDLRVLHLKYADAAAMVPMLEKIAASLVKKDAAGKTLSSGTGEIIISSYSGANAIVINANPEMQQHIAGVVETLDVARPQVLVEAIIVEVSENASKELGLQYVLAGGDSSNIPFSVANYSSTAPNILAATGAIVVGDDTSTDSTSSASDLLQTAAVDSLLGLNGFALGAAGQTSGGGIFGVILNALANDTDSNILSTPSIMTLDNQPASFVAGQEIPISTGEALGSANSNPFRTIERKEVGIKLEVLPQINEGDEIRLAIVQEVSSIAGPVSADSSELITNKRELQTTVRVSDGDVVVLGGLTEQNERISIDKVPLLGDIPLLGRAFRSEGKLNEKRNLMIFLRPTIIRSRADLERVTDQKYDFIRNSQISAGSKLSVDALMQSALGIKVGSDGTQ